MNWLWLVIGVALGAGGQRLLWRGQRRRECPQPMPSAEPDSSHWLDYLRALEQSQFQGGFLARTAHELRSPLSSLMGLQQLILTDLCDDAEEERQCVAQSYEAAQKLHGLMDQLIRVSKLEQGTQRLDIQPIALNVLLEDLESYVHLQVADRNSRLHWDVPAQSIYVQADYNSLRQALVMLVELALGQKAREIRLGLAIAEDSIKLSLFADQPWVPLQERWGKLEGETGAKREWNGLGYGEWNGEWNSEWNSERLAQLKQSLAQSPGQSFVPHRLSPGMALLLAQFILELNGGRLTLVEQVEPKLEEATANRDPSWAAASPAGALDLAYGLDCWLRAA